MIGRAFLLTVVLALTLSACGESPSPEREVEAPAVEVIAARSGDLPLVAETHGDVRARNHVELRPEIAATVAAVLADTGDKVSRGQVLVQLRSDRLQEQLRQAEAELELARAVERQELARRAEVERRLERTRALARQNLVSDLDLDAVEAEFLAAAAAADRAAAEVTREAASAAERRADLGRATVRAPVDGRLGPRRAHVGQLVDPSTVLFELGAADSVTVDVPITEALLPQVEVGTPVDITTVDGGVVSGSITRLAPFLADRVFRSRAEVDLDAGSGLLPGASVAVTIRWGAAGSATLVPTAALWEDPATGALSVFVASGTEASADLEPTARAVVRRPVELLGEGAGLVALTPLEAGELVVVNGQHLLADAERVRVRLADWDTVLAVQAEPRESLLARFLERQREYAAAGAAAPPAVEQFLETGRSGEGP